MENRLERAGGFTIQPTDRPVFYLFPFSGASYYAYCPTFHDSAAIRYWLLSKNLEQNLFDNVDSSGD